MFHGILLMLTVAQLGQSGTTVRKPAAEKMMAKAPAKVPPLTLPANAVASGPNQWVHTDAAGKEWIYRQGPFGLTKAPKGAAMANESRLHEGIVVVEQGDRVQFSRQGPFGRTSWTKKLDEVNDVERTAIEKSRAARSKQ